MRGGLLRTALWALLAGFALPATASAATFYVNQSDSQAYDRTTALGKTLVNRCTDPDAPCETISYAEARADNAAGNVVRAVRLDGGRPKAIGIPIRGLRGKPGVNRIRFEGRLSATRSLEPGTYRLLAPNAQR